MSRIWGDEEFFRCSLRATGPAGGPSSPNQSKSWTCTDVSKCKILNTWILPHREATASACRSVISEQSFLWNVLLCLFSLSLSPNCVSVPPSLIPHFLLYTSCPLTLSAPLRISLACPYPAQTRAKRLILALRPSKLSQLSSFSPLSVSISSNTLPGCCYGHQSMVVLLTSLCEDLVSSLSLNHCLKTPQTCQHIFIQAHPNRADAQYWRYRIYYWYVFI